MDNELSEVYGFNEAGRRQCDHCGFSITIGEPFVAEHKNGMDSAPTSVLCDKCGAIRDHFEFTSVDRSSVQLSIYDNHSGSLTLYAWDEDDYWIGHRRWQLDGTADLIRAYWIVRRWARQSTWTRRLSSYKHNWMRWPQYGPPLVDQFERTPAAIARERSW